MTNISSSNMLVKYALGIGLETELIPILNCMDNDEDRVRRIDEIEQIRQEILGQRSFIVGVVGGIASGYTANRNLRGRRLGPFVDAVLICVSSIVGFIAGLFFLSVLFQVLQMNK